MSSDVPLKNHSAAEIPPAARMWHLAVSRTDWDAVDPMIGRCPIISRPTRLGSAGSCFAQHIAGYIRQMGYNYYVTEKRESEEPLFSARYGNLYTPRQFLQLILRAYGDIALDEPLTVWRRLDNQLYIDAFRPSMAIAVGTEQQALEDREKHLACVREFFENVEVFICTFGLTETWAAKKSGLVFPVPPGAANVEHQASDFEPINFKVAEMTADFGMFIQRLRAVNPKVKIILTVSPVSLFNTNQPQHVLAANCYSKSALRAAAQEISDSHREVYYFPSYEIIAGPHVFARFYQPDLREVTPAGVNKVMSLFWRHFTEEAEAAPVDVSIYIEDVICDEEGF